jgi:hypothetical protein
MSSNVSINQSNSDKSNKIDSNKQLELLYNVLSELDQYKRCCIDSNNINKELLYSHLIKEMKFTRILILTDSPITFIDNYNIITYNEYMKKYYITRLLSNLTNNFVLTCDYKNSKKLLKYIKDYHITFDVIIYQDAHLITKWIDLIPEIFSDEELNKICLSNYITDNTICKYKIYDINNINNININSMYFGQILSIK